ncbi:hypothetical protein R6Z07F_019945 [Ovis aries]
MDHSSLRGHSWRHWVHPHSLLFVFPLLSNPSGHRDTFSTKDSPGRNMSGQVASTLGPTDQDSSQLDEPVVQPSVEQPEQEEPPAEIQDITPRKEEVHGEDPVNRDEEEEKDASEDSGLEADLQELSLAKTGGEGGDGPDVREEFASNIEPVEMPEAGEGQPFA